MAKNQKEKESEKKLLVIIVNHGFAEEVVEKSRVLGATGATILSARGSAGVGETFLGMHITPEKDVVLIILDAQYAERTMKGITSALGITSGAGGICFCLPVDNMTRKIVEDNIKS